MVEALLIALAGALAGAMNAIAGGGSFVSLPALIATGLPPVIANATSTLALVPGSLASAWVYRKDLAPIGAASQKAMLAVTVAGGIVGSVLLLAMPSSSFEAALPWLLLGATITLAVGPSLSRWLARRRLKAGAAALLAVQFALGVYGGYFGGAVGIMMMAVWGLIESRDLKSLNAPRTLLVSAANVIAVLTFILAGAVRWPETLAMLIGAIGGGYGGACLGRVAPPRVIRAGTLFLTACITLAFFARTYMR